MPIDVLRYFDALGLPIAEAWGMSETAGAGTANPPGAIRHGTCGTALPGVELRLAGDGELLVRGPIVMRGYRDDPAATAAAIDDDGWLRTGDVAHIDDDGYVSIVDRKKELIISAGGKNMSPANIESELVGSLAADRPRRRDRRPPALRRRARRARPGRRGRLRGRARDRRRVGRRRCQASPRCSRRSDAAVDAANARLSRVERIKRFAVVPEEWHAGGEQLTPTLKLKRRGDRAALRGRDRRALLVAGPGASRPATNP